MRRQIVNLNKLLLFVSVALLPIQAQDCVRGNPAPAPAPYFYGSLATDRLGRVWTVGGDGTGWLRDGSIAGRSIKLPTRADLRQIRWFKSETGFIVGTEGTIFRTTDGGNSWVALNSESNLEMNAIDCVSGNRCVIASDGGNVLVTADHGEIWKTIRTPVQSRLRSIDFSTKSILWAVGDEQTVIKSNDFGKSWQRVDLSWLSKIRGKGWASISDSFSSVQFKNSFSGCISGVNVLVCTHDRGRSWRAAVVQRKEQYDFVGIVYKDRSVIAVERCGNDLISRDKGQVWRDRRGRIVAKAGNAVKGLIATERIRPTK